MAASVYNLLNQSYDDPGGPEHRQDTIEQDVVTVQSATLRTGEVEFVRGWVQKGIEEGAKLVLDGK